MVRASQWHLKTERSAPADAEVPSHALMLRTGMIRMHAAGIYTWMPLGHRVIQKISNIIRQELNAASAVELSMPFVQPAELWRESDRWNQYGDALMKMTDRRDREFCLAPTHEEVISAIAREELTSYKQLPINFYQIGLKFRDETRPRFGVLRAREFIMKDAYSFNESEQSQAQTFNQMCEAYGRIFTRIGLNWSTVVADSGDIGGDVSREFHATCAIGEDYLVIADKGDYAANLEVAVAAAPPASTAAGGSSRKVSTPNISTIEALKQAFPDELTDDQCLKSMIVRTTDNEQKKFAMCVIRGDDELNLILTSAQPYFAGAPIQLASATEIHQLLHDRAGPGSLGPVKSPVTVLADRQALACSNFAVGANEDGYHLFDVNWADVDDYQPADLRTVKEGDAAIGNDDKATLQIVKGIEVGHVFQLGNEKYAEAMNVTVQAADGSSFHPWMTCAGIGVTRIASAVIEQHHDDKGISWPLAVAPFQIAIVDLSAQKQNTETAQATDNIAQQLIDGGIAADEIYIDDRALRPGVKLADIELIGIPYVIIVGERGLANGQVELRRRSDQLTELVELDQVSSAALDLLSTSAQ